MKTVRFIIPVIISISLSITSVYAQGKKNLSKKELNFNIGIGNHFASSLLPTKQLLSKSEINQIFKPPKFTLNPEFNIGISKQYEKIDLGIRFDAILFLRVLGVAISPSAFINYDLQDRPKTAFLHGKLGYSFFGNIGLNQALGIGYKLNDLRIMLGYNNQISRFSVLDNNQFQSSRIGSFYIKANYSINFSDLKLSK